jgi:hypothetical protein
MIRTAVIKRATPPWADRKAIAELYRRCRQISLETGVPHHVDHDIPLMGANISGLHVESNLKIVPARVNQQKGKDFR